MSPGFGARFDPVFFLPDPGCPGPRRRLSHKLAPLDPSSCPPRDSHHWRWSSSCLVGNSASSASYGAPCSVEPWGSSPVRWSFRSLGVTSNPPVPWRRPRVVVLGRGAPTYHIGGLLRGFPHAMTDGSARASPIEAGKAICHVHDFEAAAIRTMRYPGRTCTSPAPIGPHRHEAP